MPHRKSRVLCLVLAMFGLVLSFLSVHAQNDSRGRKYKAPPPAARIQVTVLKAGSGKPIEHAAVIFHPIEGDKDKGALELKTNEDGKVLIDVIPVGDTVRLQVIASGYQTYGHDYKIDKDEMSMEVRMSRPVADYSIYKNNNGGNGSGSPGAGNGNSSDGQKQQNPPDQNQQQPK
jgi:hypothetical protein